MAQCCIRGLIELKLIVKLNLKLRHFFCLQYDEHLTQLENNISLVQQRAMEQADSWMGPEEDNFHNTEPEFRGVINRAYRICKLNHFYSLLDFFIFVLLFFRVKQARLIIRLEKAVWTTSNSWTLKVKRKVT